MRSITGLSLFSGVDVARMAVAELGLDVDWYSSEIDKFAIQGAKALYDNTTYLGDMTKWDTWEDEKGFDFGKVDILFAGFPCQAWSLAGKQKGDDDPRGALVHDLLDIWSYIKALNPNVKFMFENVAMKKQFMTFINELFGYEPTMINSALLTAQNRKRNYWSNWDISQPEDKGILLKDIIENEVDSSFNSQAHKDFTGGNQLNPNYKSQANTIHSVEKKSPTICAGTHGYALGHIERPCELRDTPPAESALCHHVATATDIKANEANKRIYADTGKSPTITTMGGGHREPKVLVADKKYRKLTPKECMRLQGFTEEIIDKLLNAGISNSQLYKMTGNSFTLPVIIHNLQQLLDTGWPDNL